MENSPLRGLWQFPATVTALSILSTPLSFPPPSPSALEAALHQPSNNPQLLADLHGRLLGLSLGASAAAKWLTSTARFVRGHLDHFTHALADCVGCEKEHDWENTPAQFPTGEDGYAQLSALTRLLVLHTMAELVIAHHDTLLSAGNFNMFTVDEIRFTSFGTDAVGNAYWYFNDFERVYREPSHKAREKAEKILRAEQEAREKESQRAAKAEKRKAAQQKKEEQKKRREERLRRNAEKWAPRVAASRVTRAAKRAESQLVQKTEQTEENHTTTNRSSTRRRRPTEKVAEEAEITEPLEHTSQRRRRGSSIVRDGQSGNFAQQNDQPSRRGPRGRRRKAQTDPPSQTAPKRPRKSEMAFSDPDLRVCTHWEVLTTNAASLREIIDRFCEEEYPTTVERMLIKNLTEQVLPEIEQHESKRRRELERKERAEFLMMNQKRSSRVQAIAERKEMEARRAAQREEELRFEEERLAAHNSRVMNSMAFEEKQQSRDIRLARKQFGLMEAVARDEEKLVKNEMHMRKHVLGVQIRRSARSTKGNKIRWKDPTEQTQNDADGNLSNVKTEPETTPTAEVLSSVVSQEKNPKTSEPSRETEQTQPDLRGKPQIDIKGLITETKAKEERTEEGVFSKAPSIEATEVANVRGPTSEKVERISSCPLENVIGKEYQWECNNEDGMPVFVLDKFFFAYRASFDDAPLEDSDVRGTEMVGLGILVPPTTSEPQVSRVEIPYIMEWVIEYGSNPKLWVKSKYAWYELRRPAVEYREVFSSARRKYELCVRIAIIGETMRGSQLAYDSIINFLSMRYGDMKSYKESEILDERSFIVTQMETLNRRSLMQSGFLRVLHKKVREDERKAQHARERAQKAKSSSKSQEPKGGSASIPLFKSTITKESETLSVRQVTEQKVGTTTAATKGKEEKMAPKRRRRRSNSAGKVVVPRAVSSIITSLINAATKSSKFTRKRKRSNLSMPNGAPNPKFSRHQKDSVKKSGGSELAKPRDKNIQGAKALDKDLSNGVNGDKSQHPGNSLQMVQNQTVQIPQLPKSTEFVVAGKDPPHRPENGKFTSQPSKKPLVVNREHRTSSIKDDEVNQSKPVMNGQVNGKEREECEKTGKQVSLGEDCASRSEANGSLHFTNDTVEEAASNAPLILQTSDGQNCKTVERHGSGNASENACLTSKKAEVNGICGSDPRTA